MTCNICYRMLIGFAALALIGSMVSAAQTPSSDSLLLVVHRTDATLNIFSAHRARLDLVKTLPTGKGSREVAIAPNGKTAYVSNKDDNSLTLVDLDTLSVAATVTSPELLTPEGMAFSQDGKKLYVAMSGQDAVLVLATDQQRVLTVIPTGGDTPMRMLLSPDGQTLYVANDQSRSLTLIDSASDTVTATVSVGKQPRGLSITPDRKTLLVVNVSEDTLSFVDTATLKVTGPVGLHFAPQRVLVAPDGQLAYVTSRGTDTVLLVDLRGGFRRCSKKTLVVGVQANGLAMNEDGSFLYVGNDKDNTLSVIDVRLMETVNTVPTGRYPDGIAYRK